MKSLKILFTFFVFSAFAIASSNPFGVKPKPQKQVEIKEPSKLKPKTVQIIFDQNETKLPKKIKFQLNAIVGNYAFVNRKWVQIGDFIGDFEVKLIKTNEIILMKNDIKIKLGIDVEF